MRGTPVVLYGAGGHAKVVLDVMEASGWRIVAVIDDDPARTGHVVGGVPVMGTASRLAELRQRTRHAIVGIGRHDVRLACADRLEALGFALVVGVHPTAAVSSRAVVGAGSVVMPMAAVNAGTRIGRCVIVNTSASVDHDCDVGDGAHIAPGAHLAGGVRVGAGAHVGIGAAIIENVVVGPEAVIGAGAAVVDDVPAGMLVVGVPARPVRRAERVPVR